VPTRVILEGDPGQDDALAILLAHGSPAIELAAITTVAGVHAVDPIVPATRSAARRGSPCLSHPGGGGRP
jgi:purine nucleosidase